MLLKFRTLNCLVQMRKIHKTLSICKDLDYLPTFKDIDYSPSPALDKNIYDRYMCLPVPECKVQATYIWIDGTGIGLRSQTRTLNENPTTYKEIPLWTFNGACTQQASETDSDCYLIPIALYNDPVRRGNNKLVLCEAFDADEKPSNTNHRQKCVEAINKVFDHEVEFGFKQEYFLTNEIGVPLGWRRGGTSFTADMSYAGVGASKVFGREIAECLYRSCLYCGIDIESDKPELVSGQWEFKTGPTRSIKAGDDLWMTRWLLQRITEDYGLEVNFTAKLDKRWPGSGLHTTFSSNRMRDEGGYAHIEDAIKKLDKNHSAHIKVYDNSSGEDNSKRLNGNFMTSEVDKFTWGIGDRTASVRIPKLVASKKKGNFEDRRPSANADPYQIMNIMIRTILL